MAELSHPVDEHDHVRNLSARVTLVQYGDYQCRHTRAAQPVVTCLLAHFGAQLRFVYRHFPVAVVHPAAQPAAEAAEFAATLGRFWEVHEAMFANGARLSVPTLFLVAGQLGLDPRPLRRALENRTFSAKVEAHFAGGIQSGVNGTPCFFINARRYDGPHDAMSLAAAINAAQKELAGPGAPFKL